MVGRPGGGHAGEDAVRRGVAAGEQAEPRPRSCRSRAGARRGRATDDRSEAVSAAAMTCATQVWPPASSALEQDGGGAVQVAGPSAAARIGSGGGGAGWPGLPGRGGGPGGKRSRAGHGSWAGPVPLAAGTRGEASSRPAGPVQNRPPMTTTTITSPRAKLAPPAPPVGLPPWPRPAAVVAAPAPSARRDLAPQTRHGQPAATPRGSSATRCIRVPSAASLHGPSGSTRVPRRRAAGRPERGASRLRRRSATGLRRRSATRLRGCTATGLHGCTATGSRVHRHRPSQRPRRPPPRTWRCRPSRTRRPLRWRAAGRGGAGRRGVAGGRTSALEVVPVDDEAAGAGEVRASRAAVAPSESRSVGTAGRRGPPSRGCPPAKAAARPRRPRHLRSPAWSPRRRPTGRLGCPGRESCRRPSRPSRPKRPRQAGRPRWPSRATRRTARDSRAGRAA